MPKTRIVEKDMTGVPQLGAISNTVYIPGAGTAKTAPTLFTTSKELVKAAEGLGLDQEDLSFLMAKKLLDYGMKVLYQGFEKSGDDALSIADDDWKELEDRNLYDIRFLTTGRYATPASAMIGCAANRGDCIALLDHPKPVEGGTIESYDAAGIRKFFEDLEVPASAVNSDPSSFAAAFTPWIVVNVGEKESGGEDYSGTAPVITVESELPASFGYLLAYANSIRTNPSWFAIAGAYRGNIPGLIDVAHKYSTADVEILQARSAVKAVDLDDEADNFGIAINPISYVRPAGEIINGNRTFRYNSGYLKATSFLNVRNLVSEINKTMYEAANMFRFEQNDFVLWANFTARIIPLLERAKSDRGIWDYTLTRLATDAKGRVKGRLTISAIEAVEDFDLEIVLSDGSSETVEG